MTRSFGGTRPAIHDSKGENEDWKHLSLISTSAKHFCLLEYIGPSLEWSVVVSQVSLRFAETAGNPGRCGVSKIFRRNPGRIGVSTFSSSSKPGSFGASKMCSR